METPELTPSYSLPVRPREIRPCGERAMSILWEDGKEEILTFLQLRKACPCAACREMMEEAREDTPMDDHLQLRVLTPGSPTEDPLLVRADWVGNYAIRLVWKDGHDSGIYKFDYLRELGGLDSPNP